MRRAAIDCRGVDDSLMATLPQRESSLCAATLISPPSGAPSMRRIAPGMYYRVSSGAERKISEDEAADDASAASMCADYRRLAMPASLFRRGFSRRFGGLFR